MARFFDFCALALFLLDFVSAEVFLRLGKDDMFSENRVIFTERELVRSVHRIFLRVILTKPRFFRDETDEFALCITLFTHD